MGVINRLPRDVYDKIAAGEVVERPASVIKELVENSIDAGADKITVEIQNGGAVYMRVADNGSGMSREDAELCFVRHATSKIAQAEDLEAINTMGFRGEALASIAAVAQVDLFTRQKTSESGTHIAYVGGELQSAEEAGVPEGTTFVVKNLFFNVPARMKFLKKDATEAAHIANIMTRFILANPSISFKFINNGKEQLFSAGDNRLVNSIYSVYGKNYAKAAIEFDETFENIRVYGAAGKGETSRPNRDYQSCFVNGRYVKSSLVFGAIEKAYKNQVMIGKFPMAVVNIEIDPSEIDINVHPTKLEVKFSDEQTVFRAIYRAIQNALYSTMNIPKIEYAEKAPAPKEEPHEENTPEVRVAPQTQELNTVFNEDRISFIRAVKSEPSKEYDLEASNEFFERQQAEYLKRKAFSEEAQAVQPTETEEKPKESIDINPFLSDAEKGKTERENKQEAFGFESTAESVEEETEAEAARREARVVGQVFNTYIIAEAGDEMLLIDQHAAHERLMYEKLKADIAAKQVVSQVMLVPTVVNLSPVEYDAYREFAEKIAEMGFETEDFGNNTILIRSTPYDMDSFDLENLMVEIITSFYKNKGGAESEKRDRLLYTIACKAAVKANHALQKSEQEELVRKVLNFNNINTCPHGRPITISMSKKELEKLFKRIV